MPFSSISRMSVASEKRGGGCVKCWFASSLRLFRASPAASSGSAFSAPSPPSSRPSIYTARNPGNFTTEPVARNTYAASVPAHLAAMSTVVASSKASAIWLATIRSQISV